MSLLKFKAGVIVSQQAILAAAAVNAANVLKLPGDVTVTSGRDGTHMQNSWHYKDRALDFRTKHLDHDQKHAWVNATQTRLGKDYYVVLEFEGQPKEHMHGEFDPH